MGTCTRTKNRGARLLAADQGRNHNANDFEKTRRLLRTLEPVDARNSQGRRCHMGEQPNLVVEARELSASVEAEWLRHQENIRRSFGGADEAVCSSTKRNSF